MGLSLRKIGNSIRDVFDANTADDYKRREQAQIKANPTVAPVRQTYAQQQTANGIGRVSNNVGARTINAGKSLWEGFKEAPEYVGKGLSYGSSQQQSTDQSIISQQNQRTQELARARTRLKDPTLTPAQRSNYGKFVSTFGSDQDKRNAQTEEMTQRNVAGTDPVRGAGYVASMGFDVITGGVGGGAGATLKTGAKQGIKQFTKQAIIEGAKSGAVGAGSGALQAVGQKGTDVTLKDIGQGAMVGGTIGAVLPVASYGAGRVASKVLPKVGSASKKVVSALDPAGELVNTRKNYQSALDKATSPKEIRQIQQGIADLNSQIREARALNQTGAVGKDVRQVGKPTGSAPLKLQKKIDLPTVEKKSSIDPTDPFNNKNIISRVRNELGGFVDDDAQMINMLKKIEKETGQKGLVDQWYFDSTNVRKSTSIANARLKQSEDISKAFGGLDKDGLKGLDDYSAARAELRNYEGKKTSRASAELQRIVQEGEATYGKRFQALNQHYKDLAKDLYNNGIIDKDTLAKYIESDDYVRIQRDMDELVNGGFGSSKSMSFGSTSTKQKRTGSKRDIRSVSSTALERTQQLEAEIQRNKAASNIIDVLQENGLAKNLVNADDVSFRREMYKFLSDTKAGKVELGKLVKKYSRQLRSLQGEVDRLNKQGLDLRLKQQSKQADSPLLTYKKEKVVPPNKVERAGTKTTKQVLKNGRLVEVVTEQKPKVSFKAGTSATEFGSRSATPNEVRSLVRDLITADPKKLNRIKNKLSVREPRLKALIEEVEALRNQSQAFKQARGDAYRAAMARADSSTRNKNTISRFTNGIREVYEVAPDIKQAIENVSPYQLGIIGRIVSTPSRLLRAGTTALSAPFALTNYARDQASSAIVSKSARATHSPRAVLSGIGSAMRDFADESTNPLWKKFEAYAGDETVFNELRNPNSTKRMMRELTQGKKGKYTNMVTAPVRTLEDFNGITEKATRFQNFKGMYEKVLKETGDEQEALKQAVNASRQNSVDFSRNSKYTRVLNLIYPYFNASVQGSRTVGRSFVDRPVATTLKTGLLGSTAVALAAYNMSDPKRREAYDSINDFEKEDNLIIVGPDAVQREDGSWEGIIKIPKPQGFRELVDPMRDVAEAYFRGESPEDVDGMLTDMLTAFTGPVDTSSQTAFVGSITPQAIKPTVELNMNKNLYTGKDIVPEFMMEGTDDPTKRAYDSTSGTAQQIADKMGVSPIQVEHFIKGTAGSLGLYGLNASDNAQAVKAGDQMFTSKNESDFTIGGRSAIGDIQRRTVEASGQLLERNKTPGRKYFENVKTVSDNLSQADKTAFDNLHQSKTNFLGEEVFDENKRISKYTRAGAYINNPNVLEADRQLDALNRKNGNPGNPLFDLPTPLLTKVLLKDALPPGAKDPELSNLYKEEWYQDYQNARGTYYDQIKSKLAQEGKEMPKSTNPYPTTPEPLQNAMDSYSALPKGTGERSGWIKANPGLWQQMTAQWAQVDAWENNERVAIGLAPVVEDPNATSKYGSGGGKKSDPSLNPLKYVVSTKSTAKGPTISLKTGGAGRRVTLKAPTGAPKVSIRKSKV